MWQTILFLSWSASLLPQAGQHSAWVQVHLPPQRLLPDPEARGGPGPETCGHRPRLAVQGHSRWPNRYEYFLDTVRFRNFSEISSHDFSFPGETFLHCRVPHHRTSPWAEPLLTKTILQEPLKFGNFLEKTSHKNGPTLTAKSLLINLVFRNLYLKSLLTKSVCTLKISSYKICMYFKNLFLQNLFLQNL